MKGDACLGCESLEEPNEACPSYWCSHWKQWITKRMVFDGELEICEAYQEKENDE